MIHQSFIHTYTVPLDHLAICGILRNGFPGWTAQTTGDYIKINMKTMKLLKGTSYPRRLHLWIQPSGGALILHTLSHVHWTKKNEKPIITTPPYLNPSLCDLALTLVYRKCVFQDKPSDQFFECVLESISQILAMILFQGHISKCFQECQCALS